MNRRILDMIDGSRQKALEQAQSIQISNELIAFALDADHQLIQKTAFYFEISVMSLIENGLPKEDENRMELRIVARNAFRLLRALPRPDDPLQGGLFVLCTSALAVLVTKEWMLPVGLEKLIGKNYPLIQWTRWNVLGQLCWMYGLGLFERMGGVIKILFLTEYPV